MTYSAGEGGSVTGFYYDKQDNKVTFESGAMVSAGVMVNLLATPDEGYVVDEWYQDGESVDFFKGLEQYTYVIGAATDIRVSFRSTTSKADTYEVQLVIVGEGEATLSGAQYYDEVPRGTTITVAATPAEGRRLAYIKANDTDITEIASVVIEENTTITVAFGWQTFPVKIEVEGEGQIDIAPEWVLLDSVFYDQELTLTPVGKDENWILEELTANGQDILSRLQVTVREPMTIHAKFVDHTSIVSADVSELSIYPNPAHEQFIIEGLAPDARVTLYDLRGRMLMDIYSTGQGSVTIDSHILPAGQYIVRIGTKSYRIIVQ